MEPNDRDREIRFSMENQTGRGVNIIAEYREEIEKKKNDYFQLIRDVGFDYDGCNTVEKLKDLVDWMRNLAGAGIEGRKVYEASDFFESLNPKPIAGP